MFFQALEDFSHIESLVSSLMVSASSVLSEMYDKYTVAEWLEEKLYPMHYKLAMLKKNAEKLRSVRSWPARPFQPLPELEVLASTTGRPERTEPQVQKHRVQAPDYYSSKSRKRQRFSDRNEVPIKHMNLRSENG